MVVYARVATSASTRAPPARPLHNYSATSLGHAPNGARRHKKGQGSTLALALWVSNVLDGRDVLRLHPLLALRRLVGDLRALLQGPEPVAGYPGVVHEEVLATLVRGDKAVALLVVEPLHRSLGHILKPAFLFSGLQQTKSRPSWLGGAPSTVTHLQLPPKYSRDYLTRYSKGLIYLER